MKDLFNKDDINEVARLVCELKAIIGDGIEEYRGIITIDLGYCESFPPRVLVDNELLDKSFDNIKSNDNGQRFAMVSGIRFFSVGNK